MAKPLTAFTFGLSLMVLCHSLLIVTASGIGLILMIAFFDPMLVVGFGSAMLVARQPGAPLKCHF